MFDYSGREMVGFMQGASLPELRPGRYLMQGVQGDPLVQQNHVFVGCSLCAGGYARCNLNPVKPTRAPAPAAFKIEGHNGTHRLAQVTCNMILHDI